MTEGNILTFDTAFFDREAFANGLSRMVGTKRPVLFLCIGTDCSTGDSLGPLVGHQLRSIDDAHHHVIGTLHRPVTALNLPGVLEDIRHRSPMPCVIAIDAALGEKERIGQITMSKRPLQPGLGVKKSLPAVGEISITGIIGSYPVCNAECLQNVRLSLVMDLAENISAGIRAYCYEQHLPHR
jgi:putative sporulation protein YyaC